MFSDAAHPAFGWYTRSGGGFLWELVVGALYIFVGVYLLLHPLSLGLVDTAFVRQPAPKATQRHVPQTNV